MQVVGTYGEVRQVEAVLASLVAAVLAAPPDVAAPANAMLCSCRFSLALQQVSCLPCIGLSGLEACS